MRFYKMTDRSHPTHVLPSVQWDHGSGKALFEFAKTNIQGVMACDTDDPEIISLLTRAGYVTEPVGEGNIPAMALADPYARVVPDMKLKDETKNAFANRRRG